MFPQLATTNNLINWCKQKILVENYVPPNSTATPHATIQSRPRKCLGFPPAINPRLIAMLLQSTPTRFKNVPDSPPFMSRCSPFHLAAQTQFTIEPESASDPFPTPPPATLLDRAPPRSGLHYLGRIFIITPYTPQSLFGQMKYLSTPAEDDARKMLETDDQAGSGIRVRGQGIEKNLTSETQSLNLSKSSN